VLLLTSHAKPSAPISAPFSFQTISFIITYLRFLFVFKKQLTISDTGSGISHEETANLFSPFFSTKKDGQGIGLTLVREILVNHGFEFSLKTITPKKTDFTISFT